MLADEHFLNRIRILATQILPRLERIRHLFQSQFTGRKLMPHASHLARPAGVAVEQEPPFENRSIIATRGWCTTRSRNGAALINRRFGSLSGNGDTVRARSLRRSNRAAGSAGFLPRQNRIPSPVGEIVCVAGMPNPPSAGFPRDDLQPKDKGALITSAPL